MFVCLPVLRQRLHYIPQMGKHPVEVVLCLTKPNGANRPEPHNEYNGN